MTEYATRAELDGVDRRLELLRRDQQETERILRDRDDEKERGLRSEFLDAIRVSDEASRERFDKIDETLAEQNKWIMRRRFAWVKPRREFVVLTLGTFAAMALAYLFLR